jgi:hypothetical protein
MLLRNQLYAGIVDVPEYGVRGKRGDFEPLISEELFHRVPAILSRRAPSTAPRQRAHPDFPLRGFVRCESRILRARLDGQPGRYQQRTAKRPTVTARAAARMRRPNPTSGSGTSAST